jgi:hypothetical protein
MRTGEAVTNWPPLRGRENPAARLHCQLARFASLVRLGRPSSTAFCLRTRVHSTSIDCAGLTSTPSRASAIFLSLCFAPQAFGFHKPQKFSLEYLLTTTSLPNGPNHVTATLSCTIRLPLSRAKSLTQLSIMSSTPELDHVKGVWQKMQGNSPIYDFLLSNIDIISATKGSVVAHLLVEKNHVNSR